MHATTRAAAALMSFIRTKAGKRSFGIITPEQGRFIKRPSVPIWLPVGIPGPRGYGNAHCESNADRMRKLNGLGFRYFADFCEAVADGFTSIRDAKKNDLAIVNRHGGYDCHLIIRYKHDDDGERWDIITGVPSRVCRDAIIWP